MLSHVWTVERFFNHVAAQVAPMDDLVRAQRFDIINRVQATVLAPFYQFVSQMYMTPVLLQPDDVGKHGVSGMSWNATTQTLTAVTDIAFLPEDVGKLAVFYQGNYSYVGIISRWVSHSQVVLNGNNLPASSTGLTALIIVATHLTGDYVSLASLNIMQFGGSQVKMELSSTATDQVRPISESEFRAWNSSSIAHRSMVVWCLSGDSIMLKRSSDLDSYGVLVLKYPRVPYPVSSDLHYIDLPDGPITTLAQNIVRRELLKRAGADDKTVDNDIVLATDSAFKAFGVNLKTEELEQKVKALS